MKSRNKTALAVLRGIAGHEFGNDAEFAKLIGRSRSWLKKAQCGRMAMTWFSAEKISDATGVKYDWIFKNDPSVPPVSHDNQPYNHDYFLQYTKYVPLGKIKASEAKTLFSFVVQNKNQFLEQFGDEKLYSTLVLKLDKLVQVTSSIKL